MNYTSEGLGYQYVKLIADIPQPDERKGKFFPQRVQSVVPNRINILIDSEDRIRESTSDFDFIIRFQSEVFVRQIYLTNAILPLCPTIHDKNKTLKVTVNGNTFNITLDTGYFNPVTFSNELQNKLSAAWIANVDPLATVLVTYDNAGRFISVVDTSPGGIGGPYPITFLDSSFSKYGKHVCEFKIDNASITQKSISLEMIYSRYYYIKSNRMSQNQRAASVSSGPNSMNIVGIVYNTDMYDETQFQSTIFPGTSKSYELTNPPVINMTSLSSFREVDIQIEDEFGFNLYTLMDDGSFSYGVVLQFSADYY